MSKIKDEVFSCLILIEQHVWTNKHSNSKKKLGPTTVLRDAFLSLNNKRQSSFHSGGLFLSNV
jgi:hypothetical protein